ncbi:oligosaccharide flippase family protein [Flavobacterium enshiense]|uniref:oligosaccharide flippase family protein n=1 Tax=Flavobacterium enshiense TaxID=1341165 RepID=UPI00345CED5B
MQEQSETNFHKSIFKATGIFGFTQVMKIVLKILTGKFAALFLGPAGVGIVGLLNNTLSLISAVTGLGLNVSSVREVAIAESENNQQKVSEVIVLLNRWSIAIGLIGAIISLGFSKLLSRWTFGTAEYDYWFVILSVYFLFTSISSAQTAIMQGKRMLRKIVISSVVSTFFIAIITVPIYYFYGLQGIVPVILLSSVITVLANFFMIRDLRNQKISMSLKETLVKGKSMIKLGILLSLNVVFGQFCIFIIKLFLNGQGSSAQILGFYEVSTVIVVSYLGMVFSAMSNDFYPALTSLRDEKEKFVKLVNHQTESALLIVTPAIIFLYFLAPLMIQVLYSKEFLQVVVILKAALFSVILKAITWPLGFIILAKGNNRQYFKQEIVGDSMNIVFTLVFYHYFGLSGIGFASVLMFLLYGLYVYYVVNRKYGFTYDRITLIAILKSFGLGLLAMISIFVLDYPVAYLPLGFLFIVSVILSAYEFNKKVGFKKVKDKIKSKFN